MKPGRGLLFGLATLAIQRSMGSIVNENMYFPRVSKSDVQEKWQGIYKGLNLRETSYTCTKFISDGRSFVNYIPGWNNKDTIKPAPTVVIKPSDDSPFTLDVSYVDHTAVFDVFDRDSSSHPKCYILPPYKPLMYIAGTTEKPISVYLVNEVDKDDQNAPKGGDERCDDFMKNAIKQCQVVGIPTSYDLPVHPFFLTSYHTVVKNDITVYTVLSIDRLGRLVEMVDNWKGPVSAAISITDLDDIPKIMEAWVGNKYMRKYVDVHLVFDDQIALMKIPDRPFQINYLRSVALKNTRTDFVFYIEADFIPSLDLRKELLLKLDMMNKTTNTIFAIPAFFSGKKVAAKDVPATKEELLKILDRDDVPEETFIKRFPYSSHKKYNIDKWKTTSEQYEVTPGNSFEPYYVGRRDYPLFDETYYGCGGDKISHSRELKSLGYKFIVLPQGFIVHLNSDGLGKPWCFKNGAGPRGTLKRKVSTMRQKLYPGSLLNKYEIPWWVDQKQQEEEDLKEEQVDHKEKEVNEINKVNEEKNTVETEVYDTKDEEKADHYDKIIAIVKNMEKDNFALRKEVETLHSYLRMSLIAIVFMACITAYHYKEKKRAEKQYKLP